MPSRRPLTRVFALIAALALLLAACAPAVVSESTAVPPPTNVPPTDVPPSATPDPDEPVTSPPDLGTDEPDPVAPPWAPQAGDEDLERGPAYVDLSEVLLLESFPVQVQLHLAGALPTPCHQLRVVAAAPDAANQIAVEVYTVTDPGQACAQVLEPFDVYIGLGSYPAGDYTVLVNGALAAEITV